MTRVMVATDGSDASVAAAKVAAALFGEAEYLLVTVVDGFDDPMADAGGIEGPGMDEATAETEYRERIVDAQGALAGTARAFGDRAVPQRVVEQSGESRGARLCAFAGEEDVDVLVVGSHGHGALADALLGSISNYAAHHSPCPVLVVPAPDA
jgi:nucleotide-binding universal stress UspA family protein